MATIGIGKISMGTVKANPAKFVEEGKSTPIVNVFGKASGVKVIVNKDTGDVYDALVGEFEAVNLKTGDVYQSGVLYLPSGIHSLVENAVKGLHQDLPGTVDFALEIRVVKASSKAGYSYEAVNLIPAAITDPFAEMRKAIAAKTEQPEAKKIEGSKAK